MRIENVLAYIKMADGAEIGELLDAVLTRYSILFPDWDMNIMALPKGDQEERRRRLEEILEFGKKYGKL